MNISLHILLELSDWNPNPSLSQLWLHNLRIIIIFFFLKVTMKGYHEKHIIFAAPLVVPYLHHSLASQMSRQHLINSPWSSFAKISYRLLYFSLFILTSSGIQLHNLISPGPPAALLGESSSWLKGCSTIIQSTPRGLKVWVSAVNISDVLPQNGRSWGLRVEIKSEARSPY